MALYTSPEALEQCRPRHAMDLYPTPRRLAQAVIQRVCAQFQLPPNPRIIEPGIGFGVWGRVARETWPSAWIVGTEIRDLRDPNYWTADPEGRDSEPPRHRPSGVLMPRRDMRVPRPTEDEAWYKKRQLGRMVDADLILPTILRTSMLPWYDRIIHGSFFHPIVQETAYRGYDLCIGNPAYNEAEAYVRHGLSLVRYSGYVIYLLLLNFKASQGRVQGLYRDHPLLEEWTLGQRPSFTGSIVWTHNDAGYLVNREFIHDGNTDAREYAIFVFRKGYGYPDHHIGRHLLWKG